MFNLAQLFVSIEANDAPFNSAMSRVHGQLSTANVAIGTFAGNMLTMFAQVAARAAGGLFEGTIHSASHLAETMNKTRVVMGEGASKVIADADAMADRYGFVKQEVLDASSSFAMLGKEMKMSESASADFGVKLVRMAADAGSLADIELPQMLEKLRAGLAGQARPLRELGIFMTAETVKQEAARMGLKPNADTGQLSEADKIKARVSFIENSEFMKKASGDLDRTLSGTENQTRKFWGTLANLATSVGAELEPAWNKLLGSFNEGVDSLKGMFEANKSTIKGWGESVVSGFDTAKLVWRNLPDVIEIAMLGADQKMEDAQAKIEAWATKAAVTIETAFLKASQKVGNFFQGIQSGVQAAASQQAGAFASAVSGAKSIADTASKLFDTGVGKFSAAADVVLRPLRDVANATGLGMKNAAGKDMSVEEDFNRAKGSLEGIPKALGGAGDFLKTLQSSFAIGSEGKPKDFTSALIDKANKHLADTMGKNNDISSKRISEVEERIRKREADRLKALENMWEAADEEDILPGFGKMFAQDQDRKSLGGDVQENLRRMGVGIPEIMDKRRKNADGTIAGDDEAEGAGLGKHHQKTIEDAASFGMKLQAGQLGEGVQDKQLTELQQIREIEAKNAENFERVMARAIGGAVFG